MVGEYLSGRRVTEGYLEGQTVGKIFRLRGNGEGWHALRIGGFLRCQL